LIFIAVIQHLPCPPPHCPLQAPSPQEEPQPTHRAGAGILAVMESDQGRDQPTLARMQMSPKLEPNRKVTISMDKTHPWNNWKGLQSDCQHFHYNTVYIFRR
jgi:hypothetical protein